MAESDGTPAAGQPPRRPTISLPPRSSYESLFGGVAGGGGGTGADVSPGPLTLVSSFFAEDPDSEVGSFSQLLAGAMSPPVRNPTSFAAEEKSGSGGGGEGGVYRENRPVGLMVSQSPPIFSVPAGLSPASLLDSPAGFYSSGPGHFGISHQQALAQVTAQAVQAHSYSHLQVDHQSLPAAASATKFQTSDLDINTFESAEDSQYDQKPQPTAIIVDKPADDGYNWRKYGQKQMKGSDYPRSYYKCTHPGCPVKKKVEHSSEGHVTEIIYKGQHSHQRPTANRRGKDFGTLSGGLNELNGNFDFPANSETVAQMGLGNYSRSGDTMPVPSTSKRDRESVNGTSEQLSESSDDEEVGNAELGRNKVDPNIPDPQRRKIDTRVADSSSSQRTVAEPRIIVQTTSEVDLLDDGFRWRKYGQKVVKGNPNPRSYYKCTNVGCKVRKHVERASTDPKAVITTYEGKHNHEVPTARNSSHSTATAGAVSNSIQSKPQNTVPNNQHFFVRTEFRDNVQQLKEEHDAV